MKLYSNQPERLYGTAKAHKFENCQKTTVVSMEFWPIIDHTDTFTYNEAKVISDYLLLLCKMWKWIFYQ